MPNQFLRLCRRPYKLIWICLNRGTIFVVDFVAGGYRDEDVFLHVGVKRSLDVYHKKRVVGFRCNHEHHVDALKSADGAKAPPQGISGT